MTQGFNMIAPDKFKGIADTDTKLNIMFDYIHDLHTNDVKIKSEFDKRLLKLEKRAIVDKALSFSGGIVGGVVALCGHWFFFRGQ